MRALALLLLVFPCFPAWADECDQLPLPAVTVKRLEEPFTLSTKYSYKALTNLATTLTRQGNQVLGLTRGNAIVRFAIDTPSHIDRTGRWECASPQLTMTFGFMPMTVHVAKEFPAGSCAYREIYDHEMRHVQTNQAHIAAIEKELTEALSRRFATGAPWRGPAGQTRDYLQRELDERWMPYIKRAIGRVELAQALIDTPEEYARVAASCDGEISKRTR
ncbi:hypothetical protein [Dechloromonas denitrificans]|uniref:hypothetical protein n=1 Tax=Dechloromonas denitrificans TaxID=281362 RepID=UPI001CF8F79F|nr:hypothetical protein [Dechloromonas denitrificans]UCV02500.1 hypothetical protein KI611_15620 [Dechloromonas denitrificans]UCV06799.1 hypothetical protein KI615_15505 [Dechloromonas denitrificans]